LLDEDEDEEDTDCFPDNILDSVPLPPPLPFLLEAEAVVVVRVEAGVRVEE
jgi:hypothetical protein